MLSLMRYFETWSATPIQPPVGAVSDDQYQKIIDKNLKSGNGDITLIKSPIKRTRRRKEND